jgi:dephospho-CoA kinase
MTPDDLLKSFGIGLTGGIATGKSTVARLLVARGFTVIDADILARRVLAPGSAGLAEVVAAFGPGMLTAAGDLDRKRLGERIFADPERRKELDALTHPRIRLALAEALKASGLLSVPRPFFYEAALVVETGSHERFSSLWVTLCRPETQLARLVARDARSAAEAQRIIAAQLPAAEKARWADVVIDTDGPPELLESRVDAALRTAGLAAAP